MSGLDAYTVLMVFFPFVVVSYAAPCGFKDIIPHARMSACRESAMDTEHTQREARYRCGSMLPSSSLRAAEHAENSKQRLQYVQLDMVRGEHPTYVLKKKAVGRK